MEDLLTEAKQTAEFWKRRTTKIKHWYRLIRLVDEMKTAVTKGAETAVSNRPRSFRMLALHLLSSGKVRDRIPINTQDMEQRDKISDAERLLQSWWREKDAEQILAGEMLWRRQFYDFAIMTRWYAVVYGMFKKKDGSPYPMADILNPANVFQRWADKKLVACYHIRKIPTTEAREMARRKDWKIDFSVSGHESDFVSITDCWRMYGDDVVYALYINNSVAEPPEIQKDFDRIPVLTGPVGGFADRGGIDGDKEWIARIGESILEPIREVCLRKNRIRSYLQQVAKEIAKPTKWDKTPKAKGALKPQDIGKIVHLDSETNEQIGQLSVDSPALPQLNALWQEDDSEEQLATIPNFAFGSTMGLEVSGYLYTQVLAAAYSCLGELNVIGNQVRGMIGKAWLDGFKKHWDKDYKLRIAGKELGENVGYYDKEITPADLPDFTYVEVESPLAIRENLLEKINAARMAIPQGDLMDFITVADEILHIQDPELVRQRIKEGHMMNSQPLEQAYIIMEMQKKINYLKVKGDSDSLMLANILEQMIQQMMSQVGLQPGMPSPARTGVSPQTAPPEMVGVAPAQLRQMYGVAPNRTAMPRVGG